MWGNKKTISEKTFKSEESIQSRIIIIGKYSLYSVAASRQVHITQRKWQEPPCAKQSSKEYTEKRTIMNRREDKQTLKGEKRKREEGKKKKKSPDFSFCLLGQLLKYEHPCLEEGRDKGEAANQFSRFVNFFLNGLWISAAISHLLVL